jgi:predicted transcriptional regulator of viral defense system
MAADNSAFQWPDVARFQDGVIGLRQLGPSRDIARRRIRSRRWRRLQRGVYATFTGKPSHESILWAAVTRAGRGAVLSHGTAAEIHGFTEQRSTRIHITVPADSNPARNRKIPGVVIHRSRQVDAEVLPSWELPRTTITATVLDLVAAAKTFDDGYAWICRATAREAVTAGMLRAALASRARMPWRKWLEDALDDAEDGINTALERRYVAGVERAHGLPAARRQARQRPASTVYLLDNYYEEFRLCVELDGQTSHPAGERRRDTRRDNENLAEEDITTLRLGWPDSTALRCESARQIAKILIRRGWSGSTLRACGPDCTALRQ